MLVVKVPRLGRRKLALGVILLAVLAAVVVVYALPLDFSGWFPNPDYSDKYGIMVETNIEELLPNGTFIRHEPITYEFANRVGYWNLTNPDRYVLEAINAPGKLILVQKGDLDLTIVQQLEEHNWIELVKYDGQFYHIVVYGTPNNKWV